MVPFLISLNCERYTIIDYDQTDLTFKIAKFNNYVKRFMLSYWRVSNNLCTNYTVHVKLHECGINNNEFFNRYDLCIALYANKIDGSIMYYYIQSLIGFDWWYQRRDQFYREHEIRYREREI